MTRSLFAGGTSWHFQSFKAFTKDLQEMLNDVQQSKIRLQQECKSIALLLHKEHIDDSLLGYCTRYLNLCEIILELKQKLMKIKKKCIKGGLAERLKEIGREANKINDEIGIYWNINVMSWSDITSRPYFRNIENFYCNTRNAINNMLDWSNVADKIIELEHAFASPLQPNILTRLLKNPWAIGILTGVIAGIMVMIIIKLWYRIYFILYTLFDTLWK